ncbi:MAG TPA: transglutaminase family protein [Polyangiaceae bacterium]
MSIRVALNHRTRYDYARPVHLSPQVVRLRPAPHNRTPLHSYSLRIEPEPHFLNWQQDPQGNYLARLVFPEQVEHFSVCVDLVADLAAYDPFDFFLTPEAERFPFQYDKKLDHELGPYLLKSETGPEFARFMATLDRSERRTVDFLVDVNRRVFQAVKYLIRMEPGVQLPEETLLKGSGSCRDSSWLLARVLRELGIAARFVSGYLIQLVADEKPVEGPAGPSADFTDLHAWCEAYVPGAGWIGLDPTSGLLTAEGHIPLAATPDPSSAAPIEGASDPVETKFQFEMSVTRVIDAPRVTKPYSEEQWQSILKLGERVDASLAKGDLRLTMGGEPTFVSALEPDAAEWNIAALGGKKKEIGDRLLRRLHQRWQPGGMLHHGQGKWYPGEQLPRWALSCFYRIDGVPIWHDPRLFAEENRPPGHGAEDAKRFAQKLVELLGLTRHGLLPAYEDAFYYLWRERRLPLNVDPLDSRLEDPIERERIARVFRQDLRSAVGWVLPLSWRGHWESGHWFLRDEHCFLLPGDSPMGLRLPIDSLPWMARRDSDSDVPLDPFAPRGRLPDGFRFPLSPPARRAPAPPRPQRPGFPREPGTLADPYLMPLPFESATGIARTALCVEPREGILRVFLPPISQLDAYLELVAAVEAAARELSLPIQLEGYEPPRDPRIGNFKVTPDPGVIEVNLPPVQTWPELIEQTESLYAEARAEHLIAEKFEHDGAHIGSGGGNHMVLGALNAEDSPFLRRPDLLASLLSYFHNHPALSYLFSGRFIGPTSQAPRVDEARNDSVYELELAFRELPAVGAYCPPWLVDRIFRHLLIDVTGNTHRAEFCIDKMYSPDSASGRLGLLELRAFEMPPHHRMSSVQQLLLRALVASFWERPYREQLVKWGTLLHDRFLLPYFVEQDFRDLLADLSGRGFAFDLEWFRPHLEFRFPYYGKFSKDAVTVELRGALEPWHVLGEENSGGGQARYVDSSLERLQVRAIGLTHGRHRVTVNGFVLPLTPTGVSGESVAGVRYRAWQPSSCLHPTIGTHGPLHVDLYDSWNERAIAGCTYHVAHAGGRSPESRPVNAVAAESRRIARFDRFGHLPGRFLPRDATINPHFPVTLDLRALS